MKFTVITLALLSISTTWATKATKAEEPKDKREAEVSYQSSSGHGQSLQGYQSSSGHEQSLQGYQAQAPSYSHGDASAVSIGAGYSIGGAKPSFSYGAPESAEGLQSNGHSTIQLAPITLHASQGNVISGDLSQFMRELSHGLNSGAISLSPYQGNQGGHGQEISLSQLSYASPSQQYQIQEQPESTVPHYAAGTKGLGSYSSGPVLFQPQTAGHGQASQPSLTYGSPSSGHSFGGASGLSLSSGHGLSGLSLGGAGQSGHDAIMFLSGSGAGHSLGGSGYSLGSSGLGGHSGLSLGGHSGLSLGGHGHSGLSLGSSGSPSYISAGHSLGGSAGHSLGAGYALGGHSLGSSGSSLGGSGLSLGGSGHSLSGSGHALGGHSLGGSGYALGSHSLGGSGYALGGHSLGGSGYALGHSLGGSGNSFGGSGHSLGASLKGFGGHYLLPGKTSFKPSTFLGVHSDSSHGLSGLSGSYGSPSFGSLSGHGLGSITDSHGASSFSGHGASFGGFGGSSSKITPSYLPAKSESYSGLHDSYPALSSHSHTHSPPATTYGIPQASHSASSQSPQYFVSSKQPSSSHFGKGSSAYKAPSSGHSSFSSQSFSSGPKYSFSGHGPSSRYSSSGSEDTHGAHSETTYNTIKYSEEIKPRMH